MAAASKHQRSSIGISDHGINDKRRKAYYKAYNVA